MFQELLHYARAHRRVAPALRLPAEEELRLLDDALYSNRKPPSFRASPKSLSTLATSGESDAWLLRGRRDALRALVERRYGSDAWQLTLPLPPACAYPITEFDALDDRSCADAGGKLSLKVCFCLFVM
jgi:hypothetical protein